MADVARGQTCPACGTLVACSGSLTDARLVGKCPVDGTAVTHEVHNVVRDANGLLGFVRPVDVFPANEIQAPASVATQDAPLGNPFAEEPPREESLADEPPRDEPFAVDPSHNPFAEEPSRESPEQTQAHDHVFHDAHPDDRIEGV
ncbi:MAG: hypothetical protein NVS1B2_15820 [Vulcanimicrobiaceae bacterium]